jgi:hypothetical protein
MRARLRGNLGRRVCVFFGALVASFKGFSAQLKDDVNEIPLAVMLRGGSGPCGWKRIPV